MTGTKSIVGVLSIMMASGTIADFDVFELDSEVHIRVWSAGGRDDNHLHKQVAAILPPNVDERHVTVVKGGIGFVRTLSKWSETPLAPGLVLK